MHDNLGVCDGRGYLVVLDCGVGFLVVVRDRNGQLQKGPGGGGGVLMAVS